MTSIIKKSIYKDGRKLKNGCQEGCYEPTEWWDPAIFLIESGGKGKLANKGIKPLTKPAKGLVEKTISAGKNLLSKGKGLVARLGKVGRASGGAGKAAKTGNTSRVFWSGAGSREAAEAFAKANGAKTLEMTLPGKALNKITTSGNFKNVKPLWDAASQRFANGATGKVDVFHSSKGVRLDSVWANSEYPILSKKGNAINYHVVD